MRGKGKGKGGGEGEGEGGGGGEGEGKGKGEGGRGSPLSDHNKIKESYDFCLLLICLSLDFSAPELPPKGHLLATCKFSAIIPEDVLLARAITKYSDEKIRKNLGGNIVPIG